jgi:hypothetical protein
VRPSVLVAGEIGTDSPTWFPAGVLPSVVAHHAFFTTADLQCGEGPRKLNYAQGIQRLVNIALGREALRGYAPVDMRLLVASRRNHWRIEKFRDNQRQTRAHLIGERSEQHLVCEIGLEASQMPPLDLAALLQEFEWSEENEDVIPFVMQLSVNSRDDVVPKTRFAELWREYIGSRLIPFDATRRFDLIGDVTQKCPRIKEHMESWRASLAL